MLIHVAVPVPNLDVLTYAVPDGVAPPVVGARVVVPLGTRVVTGIVVETGVAPPNTEPRTPNAEPRTKNEEPRTNDEARTTNVKPVREILDTGAFVPPEVVALARWTAEYYASGVGDAIPALLPPMARGARADAHKKLRVAAITPAGLEALDTTATITAKQQEALALLAGTPTGIATPALASRGIAADTISRLARRGYISLRHDTVDRNPFAGPDRGQTGVGHPSAPPRRQRRGRTRVRPQSGPGLTPRRGRGPLCRVEC